MNETTCPMCTMTDLLEHPEKRECLTCGHEWAREAEPEQARTVKDAHGNKLADGDCVVLIKDLKLGGGVPGPERRIEIEADPSRGRGPRNLLQNRRNGGGFESLLR